MPTRRQFLTTLGATATALATPSAAVGPYAEQPEHVSLVFDQTVLERYRPLLVTRTLSTDPDWLYGWVATSPERDTEIACYWAWYGGGQKGVTAEDSHVPDREPVYVEYDPRSGTVERVHYDGWHYLAASSQTPPLYQQTHPQLHIVDPWHNYRTTTEAGAFVDLANLHDRYEAWLDNDWRVDRSTVVNPWRIRERRHWWPDYAGVSADALVYRTLLTVAQRTGIDIDGAKASDLT